MKIKQIIKNSINSLFYGLKSADDIIIDNNKIDNTIVISASKSVFNDLLEQKETQSLKETRDKYYRVLKESDKYKVDVAWKETGDLSAVANKKSIYDFMKHPPVLVNSDEKLILIQDNFKIGDETKISTSLYDYETTLKVIRDGYKDRFEIEQFTNKIVLKEKENKVIVNLYVTKYPSQFGKIDAILISNLNNIKEQNIKNVDFLKFNEIEFITNKPWGDESLKFYKIKNLSFQNIELYDGNFVLSFIGDFDAKGLDITEKYKDDKLTVKYNNKMPKSNTINAFMPS